MPAAAATTATAISAISSVTRVTASSATRAVFSNQRILRPQHFRPSTVVRRKP